LYHEIEGIRRVIVHREHFSQKIRDIDRKILLMGNQVNLALESSIKALEQKDRSLSLQVIEDDETINDLEIEIQDLLTVLIATEQPVAGDLRHIITCLKVVTQLERMGDHAVHIAKSTLLIVDEKYIKPLIDIPQMALIASRMLQESLDAFVSIDPDRAREIAQIDDQVDNLRDQLNREMFTFMNGDIGKFNQATTLMFISRWIERFADHVTNICEWIIYDCTGTHVELNL
jgi:phosphate transport system protein